MLESYHDAQQALDMALNLFNGGYLPLEQRCLAENLFWAILRQDAEARRAAGLRAGRAAGPRRHAGGHVLLQLLAVPVVPDSWAIKQLFPVMPIHRLNERPTRHAVLGDITCDSDGKIDQFIDRRDVKRTLPLHPSTASRTTSARSWSARTRRSWATCTTCSATPTPCTSAWTTRGSVVLDAVIKGDTVREVLDYVEFDADTLVRKLRHDVELAVREGRIDYEESGRLLEFYEEGLHGYTYLEESQRTVTPFTS